jgi:hypothetical protein
MLFPAGAIANDNRMADIFYTYLVNRYLTIIPGVLHIWDLVRNYGRRPVHVCLSITDL